MENEIIDFKKYLFLEKKFDCPFETEWLTVSKDASEWVCKGWKENFKDKKLYAFISYPVKNNNKINLYKYKKGILYKKTIPYDDKDIIYKIDRINDKYISFMEIISLNDKSLPFALNFGRNAKKNFTFFCNEKNIVNFPYFSFIENEYEKSKINIIYKKVMDILLDKGINPVRTWGAFDDRELWCQIFA